MPLTNGTRLLKPSRADERRRALVSAMLEGLDAALGDTFAAHPDTVRRAVAFASAGGAAAWIRGDATRVRVRGAFKPRQAAALRFAGFDPVPRSARGAVITWCWERP
jgi:hypothetical protein